MDWKAILSDLRRAQISQARIAAECGIAQSTISELASGDIKEPRYTVGLTLLRLHRQAQRKLKAAA